MFCDEKVTLHGGWSTLLPKNVRFTPLILGLHEGRTEVVHPYPDPGSAKK